VPPPPAVPAVAGTRRFGLRYRKGLVPPAVPSPGFTPPPAVPRRQIWRPRWFRHLPGRRAVTEMPVQPGAPLVPVPPGATVTDPREGQAFAARDPREGQAFAARDPREGSSSAAAGPSGRAGVSDPREGTASPAADPRGS